MSSLLEQAIVDADELLTAALKNAEAVVVSKYATQIKEAVDALLEQPEEDEETGAMLGPDSDEDVGKLPDAGQAGEELCPCPEEGEQQAFEISAKELEFTMLDMPSGAGHDAQAIANIAPVAMIFVPSVDGISHSKEEYSTPEDCTNGTQVLLELLLLADDRF